MRDGNLLLCGTKEVSGVSHGVVTVLSATGQLVHERLYWPPDDEAIFSARFDRCIKWGDGFAVLGGASKNVPGTLAGVDWMMRLGPDGAKQWELVGTSLVGIDAVETAEHDLVMVNEDPATKISRLVRVTPDGHIALTREIKGLTDNMVRSLAPTSTLKVLTNIDSSDTALLTFDSKLDQLAAPRKTRIKTTINGCAWTVADGSVAIFSNVFTDQGLYRSTVVRIGPTGGQVEGKAFPVPTPQSISASVIDAVPVSERTFVAVRDLHGDSKSQVILSWVTFK
jgi:hypothetical protein